MHLLSIPYSIWAYGSIYPEKLFNLNIYVSVYFNFQSSALTLTFTSILFSLPWENQQTISGWAYGVVFILSAGGVFIFINYVFLTLLIAVSLHFYGFSERFKAIIRNWDETVDDEIETFKSSQILKEALEFHILAKE